MIKLPVGKQNIALGQGLGSPDDYCKHDLRTSFVEKQVIVYCTKCDYRTKLVKKVSHEKN